MRPLIRAGIARDLSEKLYADSVVLLGHDERDYVIVIDVVSMPLAVPIVPVAVDEARNVRVASIHGR